MTTFYGTTTQSGFSYQPEQDNSSSPKFPSTDISDSSSIFYVMAEMIPVIIYSILIVVGLLCNFTLMLLLIHNKLFHNITNVFIFVLALSDVILCGISAPLQILYDAFNILLICNWSCKLLFAFFGMPLHISCLTVLLISIDRYRMIVKPFQPRITHREALLYLSIVALISVINSVPVCLFTSHVQIHNTKHCFCTEQWPEPHYSRLLYSLHISLFLIVLPLLITIFLYSRIYLTLQRQRNFHRTKLIDRLTRRTNKILFCSVVCFMCCWMPWTLYSVYLEISIFMVSPDNQNLPVTSSTALPLTTRPLFPNSNSSSNHLYGSSDFHYTDFSTSTKNLHYGNIRLLDIYLKMLCVFSTCINPFLYGWINRSIRFKMLLRR